MSLRTRTVELQNLNCHWNDTPFITSGCDSIFSQSNMPKHVPFVSCSSSQIADHHVRNCHVEFVSVARLLQDQPRSNITCSGHVYDAPRGGLGW
ncbi:unnamed protein product, partial [Mycena citricolor]